MISKESLIGDWELVQHPQFENARGLLVYREDDAMSVAIMGERETFLAYSGKFSLRGTSVLHEIEVANEPKLIGSKQERTVELVGDNLTLSMKFPTGAKIEIKWKRKAIV